jgi:hypothetical protein
MYLAHRKKPTSILTTICSLVTLFAVMIRAFVPQGFMLETDAATGKGGIQIVLCTSQGMVKALLNEDGQIIDQQSNGGSHDQNGGQDGSDCAYASSLTTIAALEINSISLAVDYEQQKADAIAAIPMIGLGLAAPPPPKTGPPTLV